MEMEEEDMVWLERVVEQMKVEEEVEQKKVEVVEVSNWALEALGRFQGYV